MSGFIARATTSKRHDNDRKDPTSVAFVKKGMVPTLTIEGRGYVLDLFCNKSHDPARVMARDANGAFCTYVGTLIYKGHTGGSATAAILQDVQGGGLDCIDIAIGNFCLLLGDSNGLRVLTDRAGLHHVYHTEDLSFISNSFIATACALSKQTFQTQEVLEYVLLGATFGHKTLLREIQLLDCERVVRMQDGRGDSIARDSVWSTGLYRWKRLTIDERLSQALEVADEYYAQIARAYSKGVTAALSGGYDSRLNLALLLRHQVSPALFVYGATSDVDVQIAKVICQGEGLQLFHLDRGNRTAMEPDAYWQNQDDVFHGLDGLTQYGFACEPFEVSHRRKRVTGGMIAINGGGGEIWRDFWKLPDRPMSSNEFVRAHFAGRFDGLTSVECPPRLFLDNVAEKISSIVGARDGRMSSAVVQSLYPRLRLRFWQGKNNSVDNLIGYAVTPFSESRFSVPAMWIPLSAKRNGWFEQQLIQRVSPNLARYASSHGYNFEKGPSLLAKSMTGVTRRLPTWLRARRRRLAINHERRYYQSERYVHARFGPGSLAIAEYVRPSQLGDSLALSRALTVERMLRGEWL